MSNIGTGLLRVTRSNISFVLRDVTVSTTFLYGCDYTFMFTNKGY